MGSTLQVSRSTLALARTLPFARSPTLSSLSFAYARAGQLKAFRKKIWIEWTAPYAPGSPCLSRSSSESLSIGIDQDNARRQTRATKARTLPALAGAWIRVWVWVWNWVRPLLWWWLLQALRSIALIPARRAARRYPQPKRRPTHQIRLRNAKCEMRGLEKCVDILCVARKRKRQQRVEVLKLRRNWTEGRAHRQTDRQADRQERVLAFALMLHWKKKQWHKILGENCFLFIN